MVHLALRPDGSLDMDDVRAKFAEYGDRVKLLAVSGASNVTGYINPLHELAELAHSYGALILADAAQLAPHRRIDMRRLSDPGHLDYVFISAHKMYAPFGTGVLIGRCDTFVCGDPDLRGGGEVEIVTLDHVEWSAPPDRDEAGSPNVVGAVALATAIACLQSIGMDEIAAHEAALTRHALQRLRASPRLAVLRRQRSLPCCRTAGRHSLQPLRHVPLPAGRHPRLRVSLSASATAASAPTPTSCT